MLLPRTWPSWLARTIIRIGLIAFAVLFLLAMGIVILASWLNVTNGQIVSSGVRRTYLLHLPAHYNPAKPTSLVIGLHGFVEWPAHLREISGWNELADKSGFIVVYPSGTGFPLRWRAGGWGAGPSETKIDVQFISDLIDHLSQNYNVDRRRIYADGLSNGGGMAYVLGCTLSDKLAAVGGVAGAYVLPLRDCVPARPVPMIVFHGTKDPIVPYAGGISRSGPTLPNIPQWVRRRAQLNGCNPVAELSRVTSSVKRFNYTGCNQSAAVVFYSIEGGGHTWPGGMAMPVWITGSTTQEIDATRLMWTFFRQYSLPPK